MTSLLARVVEWYTRTTQNRVTKNHGGSSPLSGTHFVCLFEITR